MKFINNAEMAGFSSEGFDLVEILKIGDGSHTVVFEGKSPAQSTNPANQAKNGWRIRKTDIFELTNKTTIEFAWAEGAWSDRDKLNYHYL